MIKKILKGTVNVLSVIIIVCALFVLFAVVTTKSGEAPSLFGYSVFKVETGSMKPSIKTDSLILVKKVKPEALKVGDVITFYSTDPALGGAANTHRVVDISVDQTKHYTIETKGDANPIKDQYPTDERHLIGRVVGSSFLLGKIVSIVSNPIVFIPLIIIPLFIIIISSMVRSIKLAKKLAAEEQEKTKQEYIEAFNRGKKKAEEELGASKEASKTSETAERTETAESSEAAKSTETTEDIET